MLLVPNYQEALCSVMPQSTLKYKQNEQWDNLHILCQVPITLDMFFNEV